MKKRNVINLIKYYTDKNDVGFRKEAYEIAKEFDLRGDSELAEYIAALLSNANTFIPQEQEDKLNFFTKLAPSTESFELPDVIFEDIMGVVNAVGYNIGVNKFLFVGEPGTGKTETARQLARILDRDLFCVNFSTVIDSKLGQTQKNIVSLFEEINSFKNPEKLIILFDEIDALSLDRTSSHDVREMGRATSTILNELDKLDSRVVLIATTNLFKFFDKALSRRFDSIISFDRYTLEDLIKIGETVLNGFLKKIPSAGNNLRLFKKILGVMNPIVSPGELKNIIKSSIAFGGSDQFDYLSRLYKKLVNNPNLDLQILKEQGFTLRDMEIITGISKSQASRDLKEA